MSAPDLLWVCSTGRRTITTWTATTTPVHLCHSTRTWGVIASTILTALDVNGASGVVLSQRVLHHTCVISRILQFCFVDLDSGVFPVGDNTCTVESGDSGQGGNNMETQQVETRGTERGWQQGNSTTANVFLKRMWVVLGQRGLTGQSQNQSYWKLCFTFFFITFLKVLQILSRTRDGYCARLPCFSFYPVDIRTVQNTSRPPS